MLNGIDRHRQRCRDLAMFLFLAACAILLLRCGR